ncbi:DUF4198 domain-containing protein [Ectothiorhodospiraceae bacterium WFHF3C12]|nr:DUF4198 domain-containing protein [Ectothiorhodospiraceae bacterium WFHF3C12]
MMPLVVQAHEFWIDPQRYQVPVGEPIVADLRVGQEFKGDALVYLPSRFVSFAVAGPAGRRSVEGTIGDRPAARVDTSGPGLYVLSYRSTPSHVTYQRFAEFERFLGNHGLEWVREAHRQRGLARSGIQEAFTRHAKALVRVGDGDGADRAVGLPLELVAEANPYTGTPAAVPVRLLWRGEPMAGAEVHVFRKSGGCQATRTRHVTDAEGLVRVPRGAGDRILVSAVHMEEATAQIRQNSGAVWHSLWASLTFTLTDRTDSAATATACEQGAGSATGQG